MAGKAGQSSHSFKSPGQVMNLSFTDQIKAFAVNVKTTNAEIIKRVRVGVSESVIDNTLFDTMTPGDPGQAKASWTATIGSPGDSNKSARDKTGSATKSDAAQVAQTNVDKDFFLTSTCDYIEVLEFGGYPNPPKKGTYIKPGHSKDGVSGPGYHVFSNSGFSAKAPAGMVRITVADFNNIVDDAIRKVVK